MTPKFTDYLVTIDYRTKWNDFAYDLISVRAFTEQQAIERAMSKFSGIHRKDSIRNPQPRVELMK